MVEVETAETHHIVQTLDDEQGVKNKQLLPGWKRWPGQLICFSIVGSLNTALDLLILNGLLWLFPTTSTLLVLLFNTFAYSLGAVNSFLLNKYWTFHQRQRTTWREVRRFVVTTLLGLGCNDTLMWLANNLFSPLINHGALWVNASKMVAIAGTVFVSYLGMRLWVFVHTSQKKISPLQSSYKAHMRIPGKHTQPLFAY